MESRNRREHKISMTVQHGGRRLAAYVPDYVVFDLETTGISCARDDIIEIAAVKAAGGKVVDTFSSLVNPGRSIPPGAMAVNHITDEMVADAPAITDVLPAFLAFAGDAVLVGHNIQSFDLKFIYREAKRLSAGLVTNDYIDTLHMARSCLPDLHHHKLTDLGRYFHISTKGAHRALNDCMLNQKCYEKLAGIQAGMGTMICPSCGGELTKRTGRYGEFIGCSNFPRCRYTRNCK